MDNRPRIVCRRPPGRPPKVRNLVESYENDYKHWEDFVKGKIAQAMEKQAKEAGNKWNMYFHFLAWAHILMLVEYIFIWRRIL